MEWISAILTNPAGPAFLGIAFALVIWLGVKLGKIKFGGVALGVTFVLFTGILVGHLYNAFYVEPALANPDLAEGMKASMHAQKEIIHFVKEFGLMLFVYCIGLQVGPSFFATFRKGGVSMNLLAVSMILLNIAVMLGLFFIVFFESGNSAENKENLAMMTGVLYGAVTNTPGLGAANNVINTLFGANANFNISNGYACAYPLGVVGIITASILVRFLTGIKLNEEQDKLTAESEADPTETPHHFYVKVNNPTVIGKSLRELNTFLKRDFVCTRYKVNEEMHVPNADTVVEMGMKMLIVCAEVDMKDIITFFGEQLQESWRKEINDHKTIRSKRIIVSNQKINGKTINELQIGHRFHVNITRVTRAGLTMYAHKNFRLQMGDRLLVAGQDADINRLRNYFGDHEKHLEHPNVGTIFLGLLLGLLLGQIPIPIPGVDVPAKLGLAGGPLVVAILIGAFGYRFKITAYTTTSANLMLREVGLVLFLAGVGIDAGASFWNTIVNGDGITYVWTGFLITFIPIIIGGLIGRYVLKLNYFTLMGMIAGSYTDPPALAFANQTAGNDAPAIGYSSVYPLTMFMRILTAQLVLLLVIPLL